MVLDKKYQKTKLGTFTRLLIPTEDQKNGAEGFFFSVFSWDYIYVSGSGEQCEGCRSAI